MKVVIDGKEYGLEDSLHRAALGDLYTLKTKIGVSAKTITATFKLFGKTTVPDLLDDALVLRDLQGIVFLARRKAGESLTVDEAGQVSFTDISFVDDDEDEESDEVESDPKG